MGITLKKFCLAASCVFVLSAAIAIWFWKYRDTIEDRIFESCPRSATECTEIVDLIDYGGPNWTRLAIIYSYGPDVTVQRFLGVDPKELGFVIPTLNPSMAEVTILFFCSDRLCETETALVGEWKYDQQEFKLPENPDVYLVPRARAKLLVEKSNTRINNMVISIVTE